MQQKSAATKEPEYKAILIRGIDKKLYIKFKTLCAAANIPMRKKIETLMAEFVSKENLS